MSIILGINAFHPGSSACLLIDGKPVVAIAEERLNRIKYFAGFPMTTVLSGTFLVTTEPAPTIEKFPISISGSTVAVAPMDEKSPTFTRPAK